MKYYAVGTRMSCPCNKVWERPGDITWCKDFIAAVRSHCRPHSHDTEEQAAILSKYNLTGLSEEGFIVGEVGKDDFGAIKNKYPLTIVVISENALSMMKELNFQFKTIGEYPGEEKMVVEGEGAYWESKTSKR